MFTTLNYQTSSGVFKIDTIFSDKRDILLEVYTNSKIKTISFIQSDDNGIDTIALNQVEYDLPNLPYDELDKRFISIVEMPMI